jgi:hypothetical protein
LKANLDELIPFSKPLSPKIHGANNPFMDAMESVGNALTEKLGVAHQNTKVPLVDFFYEFTPGVQPARLFELLEKSWADDSLS